MPAGTCSERLGRLIVITDEELAKAIKSLRISGTDSQDIEVKASVGKLPSSIVESVSAFANASGGVVLDPEVVAQLLTRRSHDSRLAALSERERQVLALIAEGRSNQAIAEMLYLSAASIEKHVSAIFHKLDLHVDENSNRRVLAALAHVADERNKP